ncbi:MAG: 8-oxo-dGTP diphosphatase [Bacilli bacterium]|nr:8-oxo-dGTP diphosphatase [Bacilli bacterium]
MKKLETTLCFLKKEGQILLALKKRGFGAGKYNGVGGKIQPNETPESAMIRETKEEISVLPTTFQKAGIIEFDEYYKENNEHIMMHIYLVSEWEGNPHESEEMQPKWFETSKLPYSKMLPDDKYWLPLVLEGKKINAYFKFDEQWNLLSKKIKTMEE